MDCDRFVVMPEVVKRGAKSHTMGTGVGQAQLQPTAGMWMLLPTGVQGGTFGKCQQPLSQGYIRLFSLGWQLIPEETPS